MTAFFRSLVTPALDRLLQLLGRTLLTTPTLEQLPQVGELWHSSWQIMLGCYGMVVLLAGVLAMGYETLQTRASIKELLPRVLMGFLAGALSLWVCTQAITIANALTASIMADGINTDAAARALAEMLTSAVGQNAFTLFLGVFLVGMLVALLLSYIIRVALTIILIAGAPLALMLHALPHTDGIARWWWKAFAGCLAIQLGQSLTLITAMRVFLTPGGYTFFGPTPTGLVNLLVALALMYVLFKIPFWILGSIRTSGGKSFVGSLVKGFLAYKTFGLVRGGGGSGGGKAATARGTASATASPDPYATPRSTPDGQYTLPLSGLKRGKAPKPPQQRYAPKQARTKTSTAHQGRQLSLPMDGEWPENKPQLGKDGQYQLPLNVQRQRTAASPAETSTPSASNSPTSRNQQLKLPSDGEWPENKSRLGADGQYRLPIQAQRVRRPTPPPPPPNPTPRSGRSRQMKLPADGEWPEHKPRADRDGQYRLPLNVRRTRKPTPPPPETPPEPPPSRKKPRGRQQSLPLNLPTKNSPRSRRKGDQQ